MTDQDREPDGLREQRCIDSVRLAMKTRFIPLAFAALTAFFSGCTSTSTVQSRTSPEAPVIVIRQYPDYPPPGRGSRFQGGLVAALWRDGRMVRPTSPESVGKSYVEGWVSSAQREEFFDFLSASPAVRAPEGGGFPVDAAGQSITIRRDGKVSRWTRGLPDTQSAWRDVQSRLQKLPLEAGRAVEWEAVRNSRWYD